jgi:hypothetical protein
LVAQIDSFANLANREPTAGQIADRRVILAPLPARLALGYFHVLARDVDVPQ